MITLRLTPFMTKLATWSVGGIQNFNQKVKLANEYLNRGCDYTICVETMINAN